MALAAHVGLYIQLGKLTNVDLFEKGYYAVDTKLYLASKGGSLCPSLPIISDRPVAKGSVNGTGRRYGDGAGLNSFYHALILL